MTVSLKSCLRRLPVTTSLLHKGNIKSTKRKASKTNHCNKPSETSAKRSRNYMSDNSGSCPKCRAALAIFEKFPRPSTSIFLGSLCDPFQPKMPGSPGCHPWSRCCTVPGMQQPCIMPDFYPRGHDVVLQRAPIQGSCGIGNVGCWLKRRPRVQMHEARGSLHK